MKVGDLVKAWGITNHKCHIGVVTAITLDHPYKKSGQYRYKVFFPNAPHGWWNAGTWNKKALELV
jgi:hypothetical protein